MMKLVFAITVLVLASWGQDANALIQREFRTLLPYSLDEFLRGYRWSIAESSILETGGGEGVQISKMEQFEDAEHGEGKYTKKILHLESKAPPLYESLAGGVFKVYEESWFTSTGVTTEYTEKKIVGDDFHFTIRSKFVDGDNCRKDDVHPESGSVEVINIDFTADVPAEEQEWDPAQCSTDRGPLTSGWKHDRPRMCVYSYVEIEFIWSVPIVQLITESRTIGAYKSLLEKFYRQMFCWTDDWTDLSEKDVDKKERDTKAELNRIRKQGEVRGHFEGVYA